MEPGHHTRDHRDCTLHIALCAPVTFAEFSRRLNFSPNALRERCGLTTDLAKGYLARGHRVSIISWSRGVTSTQTWNDDALRLTVVPMRNTSTGLPALVREMATQIRRTNTDVVHAHWLYEFADAALTSKIPCLVTTHDSPWRIASLMRQPYWWYRALYAQFRVLPRIRNLSAVSPYMRNEIRRRCGYRRPIAVIPNAVPSHQAIPIFRRHRLNNVAPTLATISTWDLRKNIPAALRAFALLRRHFPKTKFILIGRGLEEHGPAAQYAARNQLEAGVHFRGALPRHEVLLTLNRETDILLHTSREESFGMVLLEAMSQGVPVIAGRDSGAAAWVLDQGRAGRLTDIEDPKAIASAVTEVLEDPGLYARLSQEGLRRVETTFAFDTVLDQYLEALRETATI